jgi:hypothetical protein
MRERGRECLGVLREQLRVRWVCALAGWGAGLPRVLGLLVLLSCCLLLGLPVSPGESSFDDELRILIQICAKTKTLTQ